MEVHNIIPCYTLPRLLDEHFSIRVRVLQSNVDYSHQGLQSTIHFESLSVNHYNRRNYAPHAKNNNSVTLKFNHVLKAIQRITLTATINL